MSVKVFGIGEVEAFLTGASEIVKKSTLDEFADIAGEIMAGSMMRVPEKTGALIDSHEVIGTSDGLLQVSVGPAINPETGEDYGIQMHEGINGERYNLGKISKEKNKGTPHFGIGVGIKFMERSFRANSRRALDRVRSKADISLRNGPKVRAAGRGRGSSFNIGNRARISRAESRARRLYRTGGAK